MKYRNTVTDAVIDVDAVITGGNWEALEKKSAPKEAQEEVKKPAAKKKGKA